VKKGLEFTVYRGHNYIAKIYVNKVEDDASSIATILDMHDEIKENDEIWSPF